MAVTEARTISSTLGVLAVAVPALAATLSGVVVDPQDLVIVGATAVLTCGEQIEEASTDSKGRFAFRSRDHWDSCVLSVSHPGFAPFIQAVDEPGEPWNVRLRLGVVEEVRVVPGERAGLSLERSSLTSASLSADELERISNHTEDLVTYAKALAGTTLDGDVIYVDGLPSRVHPPAETIERLRVNGDPFSAEFSESDRNRIAITTRYPDRRFRPSFGGDFLGASGGSVLASGLDTQSRSASLGLSGPIPLSALAFSVHGRLSSNGRDEPILAVTDEAPPSAPSSSESSSFFVGAYYSALERLRADVSFQQSTVSSSNSNVGGLTLPEAAFGTMSRSSQLAARVELDGRQLVYQGGVVFGRTRVEQEAGQSGPGVSVLDTFVSGGAELVQSRGSRRDWIVKGLVRSKGARFWSAGFTASGSDADELEVPNPNGFLQFDNLSDYDEGLQGAPNGTWFVDVGDAHVRYGDTVAALFAQSDLVQRPAFLVRGGLRADLQTGDTAFLSPRVFATTEVRGFTLSGGGGAFVHSWSNDLFTEVMKGGGEAPRRYIVKGVSIDDVHEVALARGLPISSTLAPDLTRRRDWTLRMSIERRSGVFVPGVEYRWTRGQRLQGSRRIFTGAGWSDRLESNRASETHQLHARFRWRWKGQTVVGHYEWIHAFDNTDGPFSFPEHQDNLAAEWARSSGASTHNVSVVGNLRLPGRASLSLVWTSRSPAAYDITTSRDLSGNGLYNDRTGRPRNSGKGPDFHSLSMYAHQRIRLPRFLSPSHSELYANLGIRAENLLGNQNYLGFGSVIGSPLFGRPWGALPGRSIRVWLSFRR